MMIQLVNKHCLNKLVYVLNHRIKKLKHDKF